MLFSKYNINYIVIIKKDRKKALGLQYAIKKGFLQKKKASDLVYPGQNSEIYYVKFREILLVI